ncbi:hypothetical protein ACFCXT_23340 [Streptomyces vinaceus]|uniref:hypothetical protein n=1 Tax=Streptomyces vinaceus TaxID=1960 RepID=UPI0035DAD4D6
MSYTDLSKFDENFFLRLAGAQAELAVAVDGAAMREVVSTQAGEALSDFDELVKVFADAVGSESEYRESLRAVVTAAPHPDGEGFVRLQPPDFGTWLWAESRATPIEQWEPMEEPEAPHSSVQAQVDAIYALVEAEMVKPTPEHIQQVWDEIWGKVGSVDAWTQERVTEIADEVAQAHFERVFDEGESADELIIELEAILALVISRT